ncbi:palmitoyltransferase ZDHHC3-like [Paramacrobiotus metropolitanus]|uniref:palmitoyltransferase ZDHHC3-like n=1 Tax=Paramacrobiotus metropolitanus TaxID=2943436 RepID=UPI0024457E26|nr:palmitoyltransferase ZDHHC3-like [Paramacrobiotus metropolitanus]
MVIFRKDPCGIMTVVLAYAALIYADYVVVFWLVLHTMDGSLWGTVHAVLFNVCIFLCFLAHIRCMLTDPGVVPRPAEKDRLSLRLQRQNSHNHHSHHQPPPPTERMAPRASLEISVVEAPSKTHSHSRGTEVDGDAEESENLYDFSGVYLGAYPRSRTSQSGVDGKNMTICQRCDMFRPPRAHHCRICQGCIRKMDHHCPWINNCVGAYNQKYFLQFLVWVAVASVYAGALTVYSWVATCTDCEQPGGFQQSSLMWTVGLMVESCIFGLFVCVMLVDQLSAIIKDETGIEALKQSGSYRRDVHAVQLLREVCGQGWMLGWLCPCQGLHHPPAGDRAEPLPASTPSDHHRGPPLLPHTTTMHIHDAAAIV